MKTFKSIKDRNEYFDDIIDLYQIGEFSKCGKLIQNLNKKHKRLFVYYVYYVNVNPHCFSFILDKIFK
jgi:2-iminoacetate synthase ThiH